MVSKTVLKEQLELAREEHPVRTQPDSFKLLERGMKLAAEDDYPDILAALTASAEGEHDNGDGFAPVMERETEDAKQLQPPRKFNVFILNDDFTTMDFVVGILKQLFSRSEPDAVRITMDVHHKGKGLAGVFTHDIAETKAALVCHLAQEAGFPLRAEAEPE